MKKQRLQHWILAGDIAWAFIALPLAYVMRYGFTWNGPTDGTFVTFVPPLLVAVAIWVLIFSWMKLDGFRRGWDLPATLSQLFLALCLLMAVLMAGAYLLRIFLSRLTLSYFGILLFVGFLSIRCAAHAILGSRYVAKAVRRVLIVGNGPVAREMAAKIECHPEMLCHVVGFLCSSDTSFDTRLPGTASQARMIQTLGVIELLREQRVDEVIITLSKPGSPEVMNLAARCRREGIGVSVVPHPYELYLSKPQLLDLGGLPILQLREAKSRFANSSRQAHPRHNFWFLSVGDLDSLGGAWCDWVAYQERRPLRSGASLRPIWQALLDVSFEFRSQLPRIVPLRNPSATA